MKHNIASCPGKLLGNNGSPVVGMQQTCKCASDQQNWQRLKPRFQHLKGVLCRRQISRSRSRYFCFLLNLCYRNLNPKKNQNVLVWSFSCSGSTKLMSAFWCTVWVKAWRSDDRVLWFVSWLMSCQVSSQPACTSSLLSGPLMSRCRHEAYTRLSP